MEVPDWCFVAPSRGLGYIAIPKAASTSVKAALLRIDADRPEDVHYEARRKLMSIRKARARDILLFTVVRNPFDRVLSIWWQRVYQPRLETRINRHFPVGTSFWDFVNGLRAVGPAVDLHTMPQASILMQPGYLAADVILRFERLADDWRMMQRAFDLPALSARNVSDRDVGDAELYAGSSERDVVKAVYADDVRLLGYRFEV